MGAPQTIVIRKAGGFYSVLMEPPHPDIEPRVFGDIRSARGFARGIRIAKGWSNRDLTSDGEAA